MPSAPEMPLAEALAALRWQLEMGVEDAIADAPEKLAGAVLPPPMPPVAVPSVAGPIRPRATAAALPLPAPRPSVAPVDLSRIATLADLRAALESITGLSVKDTAMNLVFGEGALNPPLMLIGEAPGEEEDRTGRPFVGPAGRLLEKMLAALGFHRDAVYITNVLNWRPPGNRTPKPDEVATCLPFLMRHIALVQPRCLLLLGGPAAQAVLGRSDSVTRMRGQWWSCEAPGLSESVPTLVTYHPAYLLRTPAQKRESWRDLLLMDTRLRQLGLK